MLRDIFYHEVAAPAAAAVVPPAGQALDGDNENLNLWVTVFGFSPANSSFVLRHFQDVGTVLQHRPSHVRLERCFFASLILNDRAIGCTCNLQVS